MLLNLELDKFIIGIYLKSVKDIDEMTDLSVKFREELKTVAKVSDTKIKVKTGKF